MRRWRPIEVLSGCLPIQTQEYSWLRPDRIIESDAISDLQETMTTPIRREDYDRLLVAYGLCAEKAPKSITATHLEEVQSMVFQDRYISKDDI